MANSPPNSQEPIQNLPENMPQSIKPAVMLARVAPRNQLLYAPRNVPLTPETLFFLIYLTQLFQQLCWQGLHLKTNPYMLFAIFF